jgi:hypothetical protein
MEATNNSNRYEIAYSNLINGNRAEWRRALRTMSRLEILALVLWIEENTGKGAIWAINNIARSIEYDLEQAKVIHKYR